MEDVKVQQIKDVIEKLDKKDFSIYFFTLDTKGNPTASVANIYEHVKVLNELGYNAIILHEKAEYKLKGDESGMGIEDWLGEEYAKLPHASIEGENLSISPADFVVIPEVFSSIMDQIKSFPCRKIVLCQNYDYLLELLPIGKRWDIDYGFNHVITVSEKQSAYVKSLFPLIKTYTVPVSIPSYFKPSEKPQIPVISLLTRNQSDAVKIAKSFYLQHPIYKWVTFKELRGLSRKKFAEELSKSCLAVWVDDPAGFGTFPLEAIECGVPVIGKIPNLIPEWMEGTDEEGNLEIKGNGVWTNTTLNIPELIATYMKVWLEDSVPLELIETMENTTGQYTEEKQKESIKNIYEQLVQERKDEFNNILSAVTVEQQ